MSTPKVPRFLRRPDERPQELLDAALEVFATKGYRATRLEEVADAAGVTKGAIYYYFDTKEELLKQALQGRIGAVASGIEAQGRQAGAGAGAGTFERLHAVLRAAFTQWCRPETARVHRLMMGELRTELPLLFDGAMQSGPMRVWQMVGDILAEGQRRGEFGRHFQPHAAARFLVSGLMHQALLLADLHDRGLDDTPPDQVFTAAMDVARQGILAPATTRRGSGAASGTKRQGRERDTSPRRKRS